LPGYVRALTWLKGGVALDDGDNPIVGYDERHAQRDLGLPTPLWNRFCADLNELCGDAPPHDPTDTAPARLGRPLAFTKAAVEGALAAVGKKPLEAYLAGWGEPAKGAPPHLMLFEDEGGMLDDTLTGVARARTKVIVWAGDLNQLDAIPQKGRDGEKQKTRSVLQAALDRGARVHVLRNSHRSKMHGITDLAEACAWFGKDELPGLGTVMRAVRFSSDDAGSGVRRTVHLTPEDLRAIAQCEGVMLCWKNDDRQRLIERFRAVLGLSREVIHAGESVHVISAQELAADEAVKAAVDGEKRWVARAAGSGVAPMPWVINASGDTGHFPVVMEMADERLGRGFRPLTGSGANWPSRVRVAFAYASTTHKFQGSGVKRVFIHWPSFLWACQFNKIEHVEVLRWLYTSITRAEEEVVFFDAIDLADNALASVGPDWLRAYAARLPNSGTSTSRKHNRPNVREL
jgi:hypothetical protein